MTRPRSWLRQVPGTAPLLSVESADSTWESGADRCTHPGAPGRRLLACMQLHAGGWSNTRRGGGRVGLELGEGGNNY